MDIQGWGGRCLIWKAEEGNVTVSKVTLCLGILTKCDWPTPQPPNCIYSTNLYHWPTSLTTQSYIAYLKKYNLDITALLPSRPIVILYQPVIGWEQPWEQPQCNWFRPSGSLCLKKGLKVYFFQFGICILIRPPWEALLKFDIAS